VNHSSVGLLAGSLVLLLLVICILHLPHLYCPCRNEPPATANADRYSTASGIANDTVKQKRSKAMDVRFYWVRDRARQGQFHIFWKKGSLNKADFFTKHHPALHHRPRFVPSSFTLAMPKPNIILSPSRTMTTTQNPLQTWTVVRVC
jgi:hypothetical protein